MKMKGGGNKTAYSKKCKYCNTIQVVWDEKLEGGNKFKEVETNLPHTRDRCDAAKTGGLGLGKYSPQGQKEFVEQYRPEQQSEKKRGGLDILDEKLDIILDKLNYIINHNPTERDNQILKQKITELEDIDFVPANKVVIDKQIAETMHELAQNQEEGYSGNAAEHVQRMVRKGETEEELDLT
jgi:hypothetical protein